MNEKMKMQMNICMIIELTNASNEKVYKRMKYLFNVCYKFQSEPIHNRKKRFSALECLLLGFR